MFLFRKKKETVREDKKRPECTQLFLQGYNDYFFSDYFLNIDSFGRVWECFLLIEVEWIYHVVFISGAQHSASVVPMHMYSFSESFPLEVIARYSI